MKRILGVLVVAAVVVVCVWRITNLQKDKVADGKKGAAGVPAPVLEAAVVCKPMPFEIRTFGTVEASSSVTVRAQVTGVLSEVGFAEGDEVKAGQLLFRIDPRTFEAALRQSEASVARTQAQLTNAVTEARRVTDLFGKGFISENDRDQALTAVATFRASARADEAAVETARIQLEYCTIRAPMDGRTGRRLLDVGNLATANSTALVTLNRLRPVRVTFAVPQAELARLREQSTLQAITVDAVLPEKSDRPEHGALAFLDNAVDPVTGTIALKAEFPNPSDSLWPGQFVDVRMVVAVETNALVIPYRAVLNGQQGTYVFVLNPEHTAVDVRSIKIARSVEDESIVAEGLRAGEFVVTDGQQLLGSGVAVQAKKNAGAAAGGQAEDSQPRAPDSGSRNRETGVRKPGQTAP